MSLGKDSGQEHDIRGNAKKRAREERQLAVVRGLIADLGRQLDVDVSVRLWNGERLPLGQRATGPLEIRINDPGVIPSTLRRPFLDTVIQHYIDKRIDLHGGTLYDLGEALDPPGRSVRIRARDALKFAARLSPFLFAPGEGPGDKAGFEGDITGRKRKTADNKDFIQFH